jgi:hypothetical protein
MAKPTPAQQALLSLAAIGVPVSLMLYKAHPFGTGDWQDFVMGLPVGLGVGISLAVLIKIRRGEVS